MSISGDLLTSATPARLLCRRGTWVLELVRLVAVDRNVFQPRVQRLEGADAVLQHLKRSGDNPALAAAAVLLMRGSRPDEERAFDAVDGDWVPGEVSARRDSNRPSAPPPANSGEVAELRAELLVLRAAHERLRERVQRLESQLHSGSRGQVLSVPPTPSFVRPLGSDAPSAGSAPPAISAPVPSVSPGVASVSPAVASVSPSGASVPAQAEARASGGPAPTPGGLSLPTFETVNESLAALLGDSALIREQRPMSFSQGALGPCWVSRLIDDEGRDVGAIVADRAATFTLGGALMSLPEHEIEAQRALDAPSDDVLGAMSEVSNNLCEAINQAPGGVQVRVKPIEPALPGLLDWAEQAGRGLELELEGGRGRLFLFAR